jgi:hypothetical protein
MAVDNFQTSGSGGQKSAGRRIRMSARTPNFEYILFLCNVLPLYDLKLAKKH